DGYAALARLQEAALQAKAGNAAAAVSIYDKLSTDTSVDRAFRELAVILVALQTLDTATPADLTARLAPLTAADNPWRYTALELTGLLAKRGGDLEGARQIFAALADDLNAPQALRGRAAELLAALKE
ncbi:MAG: tetratricopeptide repeat protein, partial [Dongiaceae bacterium]